MPNILLNLQGKILDLYAVSWIADSAVLVLHVGQAFHVCAEGFDDAEAVAQDIVVCEERVLFLKRKAHVIDCVARREDSLDGGALCLKNLSVFNGLLATVGLIFVDA